MAYVSTMTDSSVVYSMLMHILIKINNVEIMAMVDTSVTHTFIVSHVVIKIDL